MSDIKTLAQKLEEAYQRDLAQKRWQEGAILSENMRGVFFPALAEGMEKAERLEPAHIAILVYSTFNAKNTLSVATILDYAAFPIWSKTIFEILCDGDEGRVATAFVQFNRLYGRTGL